MEEILVRHWNMERPPMFMDQHAQILESPIKIQIFTEIKNNLKIPMETPKKYTQKKPTPKKFPQKLILHENKTKALILKIVLYIT